MYLTFIRLHRNKYYWHEFLDTLDIQLYLHHFKRYKYQLINFYKITPKSEWWRTIPLSEEYLYDFADYHDIWHVTVNNKFKLSEKFLNSIYRTIKNRLGDEFENNLDNIKMNLKYVTEYNKLSEEFIICFEHFLDWKTISKFQKDLSPEFKFRFKDYLK